MQPGLISPRSFKEKLNLPTSNYNNICKSIIQLIPSDWMPILKSKTSQKSIFKIFYYNNRRVRKVKNLQKLSNKEIYFTLQNNNENYNKPFKFITRTNTFKEHSVFTPDTWGKVLPTGLKNVPMIISSPFGINLSTFPYLWTLRYTGWGLISILCVLDAKNEMNLIPISFFSVDCLKLL